MWHRRRFITQSLVIIIFIGRLLYVIQSLDGIDADRTTAQSLPPTQNPAILYGRPSTVAIFTSITRDGIPALRQLIGV